MKKKAFPKKIYVAWEYPERSEEEPWMVVHTHPSEAAEINNEVDVGIYQLIRKAMVKTTSKIE